MTFNVHDRRHPLEPARDRATEAQHSRAPPVPRAPRAKPRGNSAGALSRDTWSRRPGSGPRTSEERRPRNDSPFSHARVSLLTRERDAMENQRFEMGPTKRAESVDRISYNRGHVLGHEAAVNEGIPWSEVADTQAPRDPARRNTLRNETVSAEQVLEWAPNAAAAPQRGGRVNALAREEKADEESRVWSLGNRGPGKAGTAAGGDPNYHGRRNIIARERQEETGDMPRASSCDAGGAVPSYARRHGLARERGLGAPQISCH